MVKVELVGKRAAGQDPTRTVEEGDEGRRMLPTGITAETAASLDAHAALLRNEGALHQHGGEMSTFGTVIMVFRSFVGIGVLAMPYTLHKIGWLGTCIFFPIFGAMMLYAIDLIIRIANDLRFTGSK